MARQSSARVLMVQGTASHSGKSLLVAGLCRFFHRQGLRVAPFKAQNMSLNSYVTPDGREIARAQAVQAEAAGVEPSVDMNPILLKPEAESKSQVVLLGKPLFSATAAEYYRLKPLLWDVVTSSLNRLRMNYDLVIIEGAGSPAEVNLREQEIVNMRVASYAGAPVLLVGDIERGGVFASLVGTLELLTSEERSLIKALVINKFRGDISLLKPGLEFLEQRTGIPVAGVLPYLRDIYIPDEDSVSLDERPKERGDGRLKVAVVRFPHISNFDDFDPLKRDADLWYVTSTQGLGDPALIILPGTKSTVADMEWLRGTGLAGEILRLWENGAFIIGVCGGYQMLGERLLDPEGVESPVPEARGLGLLPVVTRFLTHKETHRVKGRVMASRGLLSLASGLLFQGYEIHMGTTHGAEPAFLIMERSGKSCSVGDGALDSSGRVLGTYIHGLFHNTLLRKALLKHIAFSRGFEFSPTSAHLKADYDKLADVISEYLDMGLIQKIIGLK